MCHSCQPPQQQRRSHSDHGQGILLCFDSVHTSGGGQIRETCLHADRDRIELGVGGLLCGRGISAATLMKEVRISSTLRWPLATSAPTSVAQSPDTPSPQHSAGYRGKTSTSQPHLRTALRVGAFAWSQAGLLSHLQRRHTRPQRRTQERRRHACGRKSRLEATRREARQSHRQREADALGRPPSAERWGLDGVPYRRGVLRSETG